MELIVSGVLTKLAFKMSKQLNFDLGEVTLKLLSKNSESSTHSAALHICVWGYI